MLTNRFHLCSVLCQYQLYVPLRHDEEHSANNARMTSKSFKNKEVCLECQVRGVTDVLVIF